MSSLKQIKTWIFDLDNTLYSADSGIFQQVHELMGKFVSNHLNVDIDEAKKIQNYPEHSAKNETGDLKTRTPAPFFFGKCQYSQRQLMVFRVRQSAGRQLVHPHEPLCSARTP